MIYEISGTLLIGQDDSLCFLLLVNTCINSKKGRNDLTRYFRELIWLLDINCQTFCRFFYSSFPALCVESLKPCSSCSMNSVRKKFNWFLIDVFCDQTWLFKIDALVLSMVARLYKLVTGLFKIVARFLKIYTRILKIFTRLFKVTTGLFKILTGLFDIYV